MWGMWDVKIPHTPYPGWMCTKNGFFCENAKKVWGGVWCGDPVREGSWWMCVKN